METETGLVLIIAAYDPRDSRRQSQQERQDAIAAKINLIKEAIERIKGHRG